MFILSLLIWDTYCRYLHPGCVRGNQGAVNSWITLGHGRRQHVALHKNLASTQARNWNSVPFLQLNWRLGPGKGCEVTTSGYCTSNPHIKVASPDVGLTTGDVRRGDMKTEGTWKNAIPNEIPAMIPRLASMTLVTSVKQPCKQAKPKRSDLRSSESWLGARASGLTVVYTSAAALSRSFRVSGEHLVGSLQQLVGMPLSLK